MLYSLSLGFSWPCLCLLVAYIPMFCFSEARTDFFSGFFE